MLFFSSVNDRRLFLIEQERAQIYTNRVNKIRKSCTCHYFEISNPKLIIPTYKVSKRKYAQNFSFIHEKPTSCFRWTPQIEEYKKSTYTSFLLFLLYFQSFFTLPHVFKMAFATVSQKSLTCHENLPGHLDTGRNKTEPF